MTESPLDKHLASIRATDGSIEAILKARQQTIDFVLSEASGLDKARERALETAGASLGPSLQFKKKVLEDTALVANATNNWEQIYNSVLMAAKLAGVKWANPTLDTASLLKSKMADISNIAGFDLGTPRVDLLMENAKTYTDDFAATSEEEADLDKFLESQRPGLPAAVEELELLVDVADPQNRRRIVVAIKAILYTMMFAALVGLAGGQALDLAGFLNNMGVNPMEIADFVGEKAGLAMKEKFGGATEGIQDDDED